MKVWSSKSRIYTLAGIMSLVGSIALCQPSVRQEVEMKIVNKTKPGWWTWVALDNEKPQKIWRTLKVKVIAPGTLTVHVYQKDPSRTLVHQVYQLRLDGAGLEDLRYGLEIESDYCIYRYAGRDGFQQHKIKKRLWPVTVNRKNRENESNKE